MGRTLEEPPDGNCIAPSMARSERERSSEMGASGSTRGKCATTVRFSGFRAPELASLRVSISLKSGATVASTRGVRSLPTPAEPRKRGYYDRNVQKSCTLLRSMQTF
jgi:hypothetical protein